MKKLLAIISLLILTIAVNAQPPIRIPGSKNNGSTKFDNSWKLISTGTGNKDIKVTMVVANDKVKGQYLSFTTNTAGLVAEIVLLNSPDTPPGFDDTKSFEVPSGIMSHNLYLELGQYNLASGQRNGYLIYFHLKNYTHPVWICTYSPVK